MISASSFSNFSSSGISIILMRPSSRERHLAVPADADGVDARRIVRGEQGRVARRQAAGSVLAVGEQDEHPRALRDARAASSPPGRWHRPWPWNRPPCRGTCFPAWTDDSVPSTVSGACSTAWSPNSTRPMRSPCALLDEAADHALDHRQAVHRLAVDTEVQRLHGAGGVHRQHEVVAGAHHLGMALQQLGLHHGRHQRRPGQPQQQELPQQARRHRRPDPGIGRFEVARCPGWRTCGGSPRPARSRAPRRRRHETPQQPGQRQQDDHPGPGELEHQAASFMAGARPAAYPGSLVRSSAPAASSRRRRSSMSTAVPGGA